MNTQHRISVRHTFDARGYTQDVVFRCACGWAYAWEADTDHTDAIRQAHAHTIIRPTHGEQITVPVDDADQFQWRITHYRYGTTDMWTTQCACGWNTGQVDHDPIGEVMQHRVTHQQPTHQ